MVILLNLSMNDEVMNRKLFYEHDGCEMMIGLLLWKIEGDFHVYLITMLWGNVLHDVGFVMKGLSQHTI